jgi:hypothetical protein
MCYSDISTCVLRIMAVTFCPYEVFPWVFLASSDILPSNRPRFLIIDYLPIEVDTISLLTYAVETELLNDSRFIQSV